MGASIKTRRILLESAVRTATVACAQQTDMTLRTARVYLNVSAASGTGGLNVYFRGYDWASGNPAALSGGAASAITATGVYVFEMMHGDAAAVGAVQDTVGRFLPVDWDVQVTHADGSNYTYSLSAEVI